MSSPLWARLRPALPTAVLVAVALVVLLRAVFGASLRRSEAPQVAPGFTLRDVRGATHSLQSFRGHPVLVNFWATWCPPCRMELPELEKLAQAHVGCLTVLGVTEDAQDPAQVGAFLLQHGVTYPVLLDDGGAGTLYGVTTIPHSVLLDSGGKILGTFDGPVTRSGVERALQSVAPVC